MKPCDISYTNGYEVLRPLVPEDMLCPICGKAMTTGNGHGNKDDMSLDCIEPMNGYTQGNMWFICMECNQEKGGLSPAELLDYVQRLIEAVNKHKVRVSYQPNEKQV